MTASPEITRDQLAEQYLAGLPYAPYRVQEDALLSWFTTDKGVLVCAPTGMGKTLIAHAALYEALHRGESAYYTTPLIALTEQKFAELQECAVRWGFKEEDVGLVTGNRRVNPDARVLVVVAEILLNRLLNPTAFDFATVSAVVVDEFHSFSDPERGIVWELTLSLLPPHVRLLLLSATVGNANEFLVWLERSHGRKLELVQGTERRVPLSYHWVGDQFLGDQLVLMAQGDDAARRTPALVFCFNREECWSVGEQLKGLDLLSAAQRSAVAAELERYPWTEGVGPKIRQMLGRGVGVHHAGMLPKYRRVVEDLYLRKLLGVCVCTETLAAGINLPARSVVLTNLMKGPRGKKKIIDASIAHQIFGRAGRPQFDDQGHVYCIAHEDDVRILRWQVKYNSIPDSVKDPSMMRMKKDLMRKRPTRRDAEQYWNEAQFQKLIAAPPNKLSSKGPLPWRLLVYLLKKSPEVDRIRTVIRKRLMDQPKIEAGLKQLDRMLLALHAGKFVTLDPLPPAESAAPAAGSQGAKTDISGTQGALDPPTALFGGSLAPDRPDTPPTPPWKGGESGNWKGAESGNWKGGDRGGSGKPAARDPRTGLLISKPDLNAENAAPRYSPVLATPTAALDRLLLFRSVHPVYAAFLLDQLGLADTNERIQALESVLELPRALLRSARVPTPDEMPPGPLATSRLDSELLKRGLVLAKVPDYSRGDLDEDDDWDGDEEDEDYVPPLADKLRLLFNVNYPDIHDVRTQAVWAASELLRFGGDFNKYVRTMNLTKQEGIIFRHVLRLILLCAEFAAATPTDGDPQAWRDDLRGIAERLTLACRKVDPVSTDKWMQEARVTDVVEGEAHAGQPTAVVELLEETDEDRWRAAWERQWDAMLEELR